MDVLIPLYHLNVMKTILMLLTVIETHREIVGLQMFVCQLFDLNVWKILIMAFYPKNGWVSALLLSILGEAATWIMSGKFHWWSTGCGRMGFLRPLHRETMKRP